MSILQTKQIPWLSFRNYIPAFCAMQLLLVLFNISIILINWLAHPGA